MSPYSLKKIAPRLLLGIIMINISIYLVVAMVDVTHVIGKGVGNLISAPFQATGTYDLDLGGFSGTQTLAAIGIGGLVLHGATNGKALSGFSNLAHNVFGKPKAATPGTPGTPGANSQTKRGVLDNGLHFIFFMVILPAAMIMFAIMLTLVFRQGILILLAISAPIACVLYILPNTEKYAKKWMELFFTTLMMYPLIIVIFAVSDVLASIIFNNNKGSLPGVLAGIIAMLAPLALVPFSFKLAGGALGSIYGVMKQGSDKAGAGGFLKRHRDESKEWWHHQKLEGAERRYKTAAHNVAEPGSRNRFQRLRDRRIQGDKSQAKVAMELGEAREHTAKRAQILAAYGDDNMLRAMTATRQTRAIIDEEGNDTGRTHTGYFSLDDREVSEGEYIAGQKMVQQDKSWMDAAMDHSIRKTSENGEWAAFYQNLDNYQAQTGASDHDMHNVLDLAGQRTGVGNVRRTETRDGHTRVNVEKQLGDARQMANYQLLTQNAETFRASTIKAKELIDRQNAGETLTGHEQTVLNDWNDMHARVEASSQRSGGVQQAIQAGAAEGGTAMSGGASAATAAAIEEAQALRAGQVDMSATSEFAAGDPGEWNETAFPAPAPPPRGANSADVKRYQDDMTVYQTNRTQHDTRKQRYDAARRQNVAYHRATQAIEQDTQARVRDPAGGHGGTDYIISGEGRPPSRTPPPGAR